MRQYTKLSLIIICVSILSCTKIIDPKNDNSLSVDQVIQDPIFAEGLLLNAYAAMPNDYNFETDVACDDAVSNDPASVYRNMAIGNWRSANDPISQWETGNGNIYYINHFLSIYQNVKWSTDPMLTSADNDLRNTLHKKRLTGEAYGLRAWYKWRILQNHGGVASDGTLLGFPIIDTYLTSSDNWVLPRNTYAECVKSIFNDLDTAIKCLPATWVDLPVGGANPALNAHINATSGARFQNRINRTIAQAIKARVALLAASPAYSTYSGVTWAQAATIAGPLVKTLGSLYANGVIFYLERSNKEILWNRAEVQKRTWEQNNFPPSLYGSGRTNPTQSLVDAFGMKNGYPINNGASTYNPALPYANRDPRLAKYIVYNTGSLKSTVISTYIGAAKDGINVLLTSTRTGYYLKKFMNENVKLDPSAAVNASHTYTFSRMTELYLDYAEAANEAYGPTGDPNGYGFTAYSLIRDIRIRAGITQPDVYLSSLATTADLRTLIHNERRIELCFEGFRFWDIRRWNEVSTMQSPANATFITNTAGVFSYVYSNIEERKYSDNMIYGPIPFSETVKYNLLQNIGW